MKLIADSVLQQQYQSFSLKPGNGNSDMYLVTNLHKSTLHNGVWAWVMIPTMSMIQLETARPMQGQTIVGDIECLREQKVPLQLDEI